VPTKQDFFDLAMFVKMSLLAGIDGNALSNMLDLAKAVSSTNLWKPSDIKGAVGNPDYPEKRNVTGFSALPGGNRNPAGAFSGTEELGFWWASTMEEQPGRACLIAILYNDSTLGFYQGKFNMGCSVRCVRSVPSDKKPGEFQNGKFVIK